jgi:hypothetical protein
MKTRTIPVNENGYTLREAWELRAYLVNENGYDFETYHKPWTKTDISFINVPSQQPDGQLQKQHNI